MTLLIESQYFSPAICYKKSIEYSHVEFDIYEHYQKMSFRNRCVVAGGNGPILLSVPLEDGRNQRRPAKEVRIANKNAWQDQHWKTIQSCYNRSPWFEFYKDDLEELYRKRFEFLVDWNLACWHWVTGKLSVFIKTTCTENYREKVEGTGCLDWRNRLLPKSIHTDFPDPVRYRQVFEDRIGFIPHLSILDLLFCEGARSVEVLSQG
jgi:hypothetical protein